MSLFKKINVPLIVRTEGYLLFIEGLFMLLVLPVTYRHHGLNAFSMPLSTLITLMTGFIFVFSTRKHKDEKTNPRDGVIIVCLSWVVLSLFGSMPYLLGDIVPNFTDGFFEAMSGFTTTGATVLTNIETVPEDLQFWRSLTQWMGGFVIIVFTVAILPYLSMGGMQMFVSEMNGITTDKLHPRIVHTAKRIWLLYLCFTLIETALLCLCKIKPFDALCHSMTTICSGGFSTHNDSLAGYSPTAQAVVAVFMVLSGCNFSLMLLTLTRRKNSILRDQEFRSFMLHIVFIGLAITLSLIFIKKYKTMPAFRESFFSVISAITTTGFSVCDYTKWPNFLWVTLFLLMFIGACSGSTTGGVRMLRHLIFVENAFIEMKRLINPNAVVPVKINGKSMTRNVIFKNMTFIFVYFIVFIVCAVLLVGGGTDFNTALGAAAATLSNAGTGIGQVGPGHDYAMFPAFGKWVLSLSMLMGRVELFSFITLFSRNFCRE